MNKKPVLVSSLLLLLLLAVHSVAGQQKYISLGSKTTGIAIGNAPKYTGLRFNFWDKKAKEINGINLAVHARQQQMNGVTVAALLSAVDTMSNGINIGVLAASADKMNGLSIGGLASGGSKVNGVAVSLLFLTAMQKFNGLGIGGVMIADTMNGAFFLLHGIFSKKDRGHVNGFCYATFVSRMQSLKGVNISLMSAIEHQQGLSIGVSNHSKKLRGIQIGLWNVAENKRILKRMPLINFNFRKDR